jgi:hypothetical protein
MPTAPRTRTPAGVKPRTKVAPIGLQLWMERVRGLAVPAIAALVAVAAITLEAAGTVDGARALDVAALAGLVLVGWTGLRGAITEPLAPRDRGLAAALAVVWLAALWLPLHFRLIPGTPLLEKRSISASGEGLPIVVPAAGHHAVDLFLEGQLPPAPAGGSAPPVEYRLTLEGGDGTPRVVEGLFQDRLATRRLGRRGTATVHQTHTADVRVIANPARADMRVTQLVLEPPTALPIQLTVYAHPLPPTPVVVVLALLLVVAVVLWDRRGPLPSTDGGLTYATAAALGTVVIFWTSNTVHPDAQTLIGSAIFGGAIGFAVGAAVWWVAKQLIASSAAR